MELKEKVATHYQDRAELMKRERQLISDLEESLETDVRHIQSQIPACFQYARSKARKNTYKVQLDVNTFTLYIDSPVYNRKPVTRMMGNFDLIRLNEKLKDTYQRIEQDYGIKVKGFSTEHLIF